MKNTHWCLGIKHELTVSKSLDNRLDVNITLHYSLVRLKKLFGLSPFKYPSGVKQVRFSQTILAVNLPRRHLSTETTSEGWRSSEHQISLLNFLPAALNGLSLRVTLVSDFMSPRKWR